MTNKPQDDVPKPEEAKDFLEFYADNIEIQSGLYTTILTFGVLRVDKPALRRVRISVSPHTLKAISLLMAKNVREFEGETGGPILLPNALVHQWGLEEEIR